MVTCNDQFNWNNDVICAKVVLGHAYFISWRMFDDGYLWFSTSRIRHLWLMHRFTFTSRWWAHAERTQPVILFTRDNLNFDHFMKGFIMLLFLEAYVKLCLISESASGIYLY